MLLLFSRMFNFSAVELGPLKFTLYTKLDTVNLRELNLTFNRIVTLLCTTSQKQGSMWW